MRVLSALYSVLSLNEVQFPKELQLGRGGDPLRCLRPQ